jgi:hypothetical protein
MRPSNLRENYMSDTPFDPPEDRRNSVSDRDAWQENNIICQHLRLADVRVKQLIDGTGAKKILILSGPSEIGKTTNISAALNKYSRRIEGIWNETDPDLRPQHLTCYDFAEQRFKSPVYWAGGKLTGIQLYCLLYEFRHPGCFVVLDDVEFHKDHSSLIHHATNKPFNMVAWDTHREIEGRNTDGEWTQYEKRFFYQAATIIINNEQRDSPQMKRRYTDGVRSRAWMIDVPWNEHDALVEYVDKLAFQDGGMYKYITRSKVYGGLGLKMTPEDTIPILIAVRNLFLAHEHHLSRVGFRMLEDLVADRIVHGRNWLLFAMSTIAKYS